MSKIKNTTKICIHNLTTGEVLIVSSKRIVSNYFNVNWHSVVEWFRHNNVITIDHEGCSYMLLKASCYIAK